MPIPVAPNVPPGWSISAQGIPIDPGGVLHPEMASAGGIGGSSSDLPLTSMAAGAAAGWFLGKDKGKGKLWAELGAAAGYLWKPLE